MATQQQRPQRGCKAAAAAKRLLGSGPNERLLGSGRNKRLLGGFEPRIGPEGGGEVEAVGAGLARALAAPAAARPR